MHYEHSIKKNIANKTIDNVKSNCKKLIGFVKATMRRKELGNKRSES